MSEQLVMDATWNERGFDASRSRRTQFPWNAEHIEILKLFVDRGLSSSQIAKEMGNGLSRNAVIGKLHRLGLHTKIPPTAPLGRSKSLTQSVRPKRFTRKGPLPSDAYQPQTADVVPLNLTLVQLESGQCKFPYGESNYLFCGHPVMGEEVYCLCHFRLTHRGYEEEQARKAA